MKKTIDLDKMIIDEWNQLGFYYDFDDRISVNQWRIYGSISGLNKFAQFLFDYANNEANRQLSEHDHLGPYSYLKIMTSDKATLTEDYFTGTIDDIKCLSELISKKLSVKKAGQTFNIEKEYGVDNTVSVKFFIMDDSFEPYSMDELIVSGRQKIVNESM